VENPGLSKKSAFEKALSHPDVLVRKWAFQEGPLHSQEDLTDWTARAASDPYGPIRRLAFDAFAATTPRSLPGFDRFLFDRSTEIRRACQSLFTSQFARSPAYLYRIAVQGAKPKKLEVAIHGLSESGGKEDRPAIIGLLSHRSARVRRACIQALRRLGIDGEEKFLLKMVASDTRSVARDAAAVLLVARAVDADTVWSSAMSNSNQFVSLAVIRLFKSSGKWGQIKIYLQAAMSPERDLSECAVGMASSWIQRFNRSFAQPSGPELEVVSTLLVAVGSRLPVSMRAELAFLVKTIAR